MGCYFCSTDLSLKVVKLAANHQLAGRNQNFTNPSIQAKNSKHPKMQQDMH